jgi:hypothetical protein
MSRVNPKLPAAPADWNKSWGDRLVNTLEIQIRDIHTAASETPYQTSNVTKDYILDADATTLAEVADVLGTLIEDLKAKGVIA